MMIPSLRVDDRLIHGQIATTWIPEYGIEQVIIVDDKGNDFFAAYQH